MPLQRRRIVVETGQGRRHRIRHGQKRIAGIKPLEDGEIPVVLKAIAVQV